jgi:adenylate cyclase
MNEPLQLRILENRQQQHSQMFTGPLELGRQTRDEGGVYSQIPQDGYLRVVIANKVSDRDAKDISRTHVRLEPEADGTIRVINASASLGVVLNDGEILGPGQGRDRLQLPVTCVVGSKTIVVERPSGGGVLTGLESEVTPPGQAAPVSPALPTLDLATLPEGATEVLVRRLQRAVGVLQSAIGSERFFQEACQVLIDVVGLDSGKVLVCKECHWTTRAQEGGAERTPSGRVLDKVCRERRTCWFVPDRPALTSGSLAGLEAVVAAPILDREGEVIGALYGDRLRGADSGGPRITRVEALLVELLASSVAAGLAREELERTVEETRVRFAQFFTPALAREFAHRQDELLRGKDSEVTILFCDIRGFSRISEQIGAASTVAWISDVLEKLSDCVLRHGGVLVDYIGDELMAMWGAPRPQPDHAQLACRAALDMLACQPGLSEAWRASWQAVLPHQPMEFGIGLNSGLAHVGNIGSKHKFKYGPLGNTVNLASRIQGATKYLGCRILVTGATQSHLGPDFATRRLGKVRVVNIGEPVELHELAPLGTPEWERRRADYESALQAFETGKLADLSGAGRTLGNLRAEFPEDGPSLGLLARVVNLLVAKEDDFDPVLVLPGK